MRPILLSILVFSACTPDPGTVLVLDSETGLDRPDTDSLHDFMVDNLSRPTGHVAITSQGAEGALVARTPAGRRAAVDLSMSHVDDSLHAELWVAGQRAQVVSGEATQGPSGLEHGEEQVFAAALVALARRFAANACEECCVRTLELATDLAPEEPALLGCGSAEIHCCG